MDRPSSLFVLVNFKIRAETEFGDSVSITGNVPELGMSRRNLLTLRHLLTPTCYEHTFIPRLLEDRITSIGGIDNLIAFTSERPLH